MQEQRTAPSISVQTLAGDRHRTGRLDLERAELKADDKGEHKKLAAIYVARGLDPSLAKQVAQQLMARDALGARMPAMNSAFPRLFARPIQAALASAGSFAVGAAMPLLVTVIASGAGLIPLVSGTSLAFLALLGGLAARAGGAGVMMGAIRVAFWGALAMALTAGVGSLLAGPTGGQCGTIVVEPA